MSSAIRMEGVSVQYKNHVALRDVSLEIEQGEAVALIGPSGAGKSTLLGVINGSVIPSRGEVWILGKNAMRLSSRERRVLGAQIGMVYQDFCLVENLRVIHNVNAGQLGRWSTMRALTSLFWPRDRARVQEALSRVGIAEKIFEKAGTLSGGQRQRVAIARVLVQDPAIILADEPIASLDPRLSNEVMNLLRELCGKFRKTLIVSCHSVDFVHSHFDRVIGLRGGDISLRCSASELSPSQLAQLYRTETANSASVDGAEAAAHSDLHSMTKVAGQDSEVSTFHTPAIGE
jgi:phosphonate transport system ATP-binding protein